MNFIVSSLREYGFALIGHSMGGLVVRAFRHSAKPELVHVLRGIGLLGTPNKGTLDRRIVGFMLNWADWISLPNPYYRSRACRSSQQLTLSDPEALISTLNVRETGDPPTIPILSVSGGQGYLELGEPRRLALADRWNNRLLQRLIGEKPNDGLVPESSADLAQVIACKLPHVRHCNDYSSYERLNHTYLTRSQDVANLLISWLKRDVFP